MDTGIRLARPSDQNIIYNSWLRGHRHSSQWRDIRDGAYFERQAAIIASIESSSNAMIAVVYDTATPAHIYSYAAASRDSDAIVLHWCYTKFPFRDLGMCTALVGFIEAAMGTSATKIASHVPINARTRAWLERMGYTFDIGRQKI